MSFIVEQQIKGRIYLYSVDSYWDKEKKQSRQKRTYIGPKLGNAPRTSRKKCEVAYKKYGDLYLLMHVAEKLGLRRILGDVFEARATELLELSYYLVCGEQPMYMFPTWFEEHYLPGGHTMYSTDISTICQELGANQARTVDFMTRWTQSFATQNGVYYDITSVSGHSTKNKFFEWGYNRDGESLPQVNMGIACSRESGLPLHYHVYPGSITDVTTLANFLKRLRAYGMKGCVIVLDRGFCSKANILSLNAMGEGYTFIQPMSFSLNQVGALIKKNRKKLKSNDSIFKFNDEILSYCDAALNIEGKDFVAHIYYNEKVNIEHRHQLLSDIIDIEKKVSEPIFASLKDYKKYRNESIPARLKNFFKLNMESKKIERNSRAISNHLLKSGYFVLLSNSKDIGRDSGLQLYRDRDIVEKMFDVDKNELDGNRLRVHSECNADGRFFVRFIALILHCYISKVMHDHKLFDKYSVRELMAELGKIRYSVTNGLEIISEISKTQRSILQAFGLKPETLTDHRY